MNEYQDINIDVEEFVDTFSVNNGKIKFIKIRVYKCII